MTVSEAYSFRRFKWLASHRLWWTCYVRDPACGSGSRVPDCRAGNSPQSLICATRLTRQEVRCLEVKGRSVLTAHLPPSVLVGFHGEGTLDIQCWLYRQLFCEARKSRLLQILCRYAGTEPCAVCRFSAMARASGSSKCSIVWMSCRRFRRRRPTSGGGPYCGRWRGCVGWVRTIISQCPVRISSNDPTTTKAAPAGADAPRGVNGTTWLFVTRTSGLQLRRVGRLRGLHHVYEHTLQHPRHPTPVCLFVCIRLIQLGRSYGPQSSPAVATPGNGWARVALGGSGGYVIPLEFG